MQADMLLHVVDVSHPHAVDQINSVNAVLDEIGEKEKPTLMVFNKMDRLGSAELMERFREHYPHAVAVSAKTGEGVPDLLAELGVSLRPIREFVELEVPHEDSAVIARLHQTAQVVERNYEGQKALFKARIPPHLHNEFAPYIVADLNNGVAGNVNVNGSAEHSLNGNGEVKKS